MKTYESYTRDDGVVMVEVAPWCYVNLTAARILWPQRFLKKEKVAGDQTIA